MDNLTGKNEKRNTPAAKTRPDNDNSISGKDRRESKGHATFLLIQRIVALSEADTWAEAKEEWDLVHVILANAGEPGTCLCGKTPIVEVCVLRNRLNGEGVLVGNVCVRRFLGIDSQAVFAGLRRIAGDEGKALNEAAALFAFSKRWIDDWEKGFCLNSARSRRVSRRMRAKRVEINRKVLDRMRASAGQEGLYHA